MKGPTNHGWNLTPAEARELQTKLAGLVVRDRGLDASKVKRVLAVDVSMNRFANWLTAAAVVCELKPKRIVETSTVVRRITFPYVPGLLSFRELPAELEAIGSLEEPYDAVVVDGHGVAHPRGLGIAAHLGLWLNRPTIGLAKTRLCGSFDEPPDKLGAISPLTLNGQTVGMAVRTRRRATPIFVSVGHECRLEDAVALALRLMDGRRIAWPIRAAHEAANDARRAHMEFLARLAKPSGSGKGSGRKSKGRYTGR